MRRQNGIHLRLDTDTMARVDALTKGEPSNRSRILREGVELRLSFESHAALMREVIETSAAEALAVLRQEAISLLRGVAEAAKANDELACQRMADFIEVIGSESPAKAEKPSKGAGRLTDLARTDA